MKKLIIGLFITAFLLSVLNVYSQGPSPAPREASQNWQDCTTKTDKNGNAHQYCSQIIPLLIKGQESKVTNPNTNKNSQDIDKNSATKDFINIIGILLTAFATVAVAVFTFFLVCYNKKMWETTTQSVAVAKEAAAEAKKSADTLIAIEKAYVIITVEAPDYKNMILGSDGVNIIVYNCGRTPATIIKITPILYGREGVLDIEAPDIPKGTELGGNREIIMPLLIKMTKEQMARRTAIALCCHVSIEYEDIFKQRYVKESAWEYESSYNCPAGRWNICDNKKLDNYTKANTK